MYSHINAVDKNAEGDYLVSSRHTETVYKISGDNGSVLWQLGGKASDFRQLDYSFSYQHDARFISENTTTTIISLFDNAYNGFNRSATFSEGKVIAIDHSTMTSTQMMAFRAPDPSGGLSSPNQGNLQFLPTGNVFLGWGANPYISEFTSDGHPVLYARIATSGVLNYKAYKFNFTSAPKTTPALYAYAHNTSAAMMYYVSWNGATEIASWTFYGGSSKNNLVKLGNVARNGFETVSTQPTFHIYSVAEAVASNGSAIRNSTVVRTFVPESALASACTDNLCPVVGEYQIQSDILSMTSAPVAPPTGVPDSATGTLGSVSSSAGDKSADSYKIIPVLLHLCGIASMAVTLQMR